jgi:1-deoxy-D-xylulose-5-phosphate synthase
MAERIVARFGSAPLRAGSAQVSSSIAATAAVG